jgi:hypothetical protein
MAEPQLARLMVRLNIQLPRAHSLWMTIWRWSLKRALQRT